MTISKNKTSRPGPQPFSQDTGRTLRRRRLELGITIDEVANETKIHRRYIKAIEKSDFAILPHSTQALGFVKRYARLLNLDERTAAQKYLLQRGPFAQSSKKRPNQKVKTPIIGTRFLGWTVFGAVLIMVAGYLVWQLTVLTSPPRLTIIQPLDNQIVNSRAIEVKGKTNPGVEVKIDGQIIYVDEDGDFATEVILNPGINTIEIDGSNRKRQTTSLQRTVFYQTTQ